MASIARLLAEYQLAPEDARRDLLLSIGQAAAGAELTLGDFGATPASDPACVIDAEGKVYVAGRSEGLLLAARSMGMEVFDAIPMQDAAGASDGYAVMFESAGTHGVLARALSEAAAHAAASEHLEQVVGSLVVSLQCWVEAQMHSGFEGTPARARKKRRAPVLADIGTATFVGQWVAKGVYRWSREGDWSPHQVKAADALDQLAHGQSLRRLEQRGVPRYQLQLVYLEGEWYAEHHDLVTAARAGVFLEDVHPWPNVGANDFVVNRNYQRYMRERGWRSPWKDESTSGSLAVHGRHWLRATPLPML